MNMHTRYQSLANARTANSTLSFTGIETAHCIEDVETVFGVLDEIMLMVSGEGETFRVIDILVGTRRKDAFRFRVWKRLELGEDEEFGPNNATAPWDDTARCWADAEIIKAIREQITGWSGAIIAHLITAKEDA